MRIYNVTNNINFGYNKALNKRVQAKLQAESDEANGNSEVLALNTLCNNMEDNLRIAAKQSDWDYIAHHEDMFCSIKSCLADQIESRYPEMNYRIKELETYKKEFPKYKNKNAEYQWLKNVIQELDIDAECFAEEPEFIGPEPQTSGGTEKKDISDCAEQFKPNEFSPQGFDSIGGMDSLKGELRDKIIEYIKNPELAELDKVEYGRNIPRGYVLYGPPGCGKTYITQALSMETGIPMFTPKVINKSGSQYVNGASTNLQEAYDQIKQYAKDNNTQVIMFIDEADAIASKRNSSENGTENNKVVAILLPIIEGSRADNIITICATNQFDLLDDAVKDRLDKIYVGLPDDATRKAVLKQHLSKGTKGRALAENDAELNKLVRMTKGFANRNIVAFVSTAFDSARKDGRREVRVEDFIKPIEDNQRYKIKERLYFDNDSAMRTGFIKK